MFISNTYIVFFYRLIYIFICVNGLKRHFFPFSIKKSMRMFSYFTIQTNILCLLLFIILLMDTIKEFYLPESKTTIRKKHQKLRGMIIMSITVVFFAYNFVLKYSGFSMAHDISYHITVNDIYVHYLIPIMTITDWILFEEKNSFTFTDPFIWLLLPASYYLIINIKTIFQSCSYPYYFIDIDKLGLSTVLNNALLCVCVCLVLGYLIVIIDKALSLI